MTQRRSLFTLGQRTVRARRRWRYGRWRYGLMSLLSLGMVLLASPSLAAEHLLISYGLLERTIAISDLEHFVETGQLSRQLRAYNRYLQFSDQQLEQIRDLLSTPAETLNHVAVAQFLYTEQGEILLRELSRVIRTPSRHGDFSALRASLILGSAQSEGGATLLDILRAYPLEAVRIDLDVGFTIAQEVSRAILQSEQAIAQAQAQARQEAIDDPLLPREFSNLLKLLQEERRYSVETLDWVVPGIPRAAKLHLPRLQDWQTPPPQGFPVVIISHGLGGSRDSYTYLANYLASGGIAVVAVEHAGSNNEQLMALAEGRTNEVVPNSEFFRRPQDVSLTINALSRPQLNGSTLPVPLDLDRIGVIGQSFGGYTALALAGATFDSEGLAARCPPNVLTLNPSLLLQCQAVALGNPGSRLADPRIKSVLVMNPIGSVLFGSSGFGRIDVPVMVVGGSLDTVSPAFPEQVQPFTWLNAVDRYLVLFSLGTHFSVIGDVALPDQPLAIPPEIIGPRPDLAQSYMQLLSLAYFKLTLEQDERLRPLLRAAFVEALSNDNFPISLSTGLNGDQVMEALR